MQRDIHLLPTFDQGPVHGANQQMLAATANESVFNLSEVVKVIQKRVSKMFDPEDSFAQKVRSEVDAERSH
jgi:hypothetical protein